MSRYSTYILRRDYQSDRQGRESTIILGANLRKSDAQAPRGRRRSTKSTSAPPGVVLRRATRDGAPRLLASSEHSVAASR
jgi:hypothetical protein